MTMTRGSKVTQQKREVFSNSQTVLARLPLALALHYLGCPRELRGGTVAWEGGLGNLLLLRPSLTSCLCDTNELKLTQCSKCQVSITINTCVTGEKNPELY